jgi:hypothetical protein
MVNGRPIKCSVSQVSQRHQQVSNLSSSQWGKDRPTTMTFDQTSPQAYSPFSPQQGPSPGAYSQPGYPQSAGGYGQFQQYGQMGSPQGQGNFGSHGSPYNQHPASAGGYNRQHQPQAAHGQWPQQPQSGGYSQNFGYQG